MNTRISFLLSVFCFTSGILSSDLNLPCKVTDFICIKKFVITTRARLLSGIPELDIEPSDPLFLEEIDGDLPFLKYKFFNTTLTGFNSCVLSNLGVLNNITSLQYDLDCPKLSVKGKYEMNGKLVSLPVEGNGNFEIITGNYFVRVDYILRKYQGKDEKFHLAGENLKLKCVPKGRVKFNFENMFNGQKDLSDAVLKFAHDNWREVTELIQEPIWFACVKSYIVKMNKLLTTIPLEAYIVFN
ncbi:unnamed protein product [Euphydryas editha]|uniref:Uncharacterized protein n=1 Tax=Euphydryas editha TaxID=104508 RepID=A0AAU9TCC6_EUPED|nr:unnamed protein product [Euphydryas editha]